MDIIEFYSQRISFFQSREKECIKKEKLFPFLRISALVLAVGSFFLLLKINLLVAILAALVLIVIFIVIAQKDARNSRDKEKYRLLITLNENEINGLIGKNGFFSNGEQYKNIPHPYSNDLDIFGDTSLFQSINRTTLDKSSDVLADWLLRPAGTEEIQQRNDAVRELSKKIDWRQKIFCLGHSVDQKDKNATRRLIQWLKKTKEFRFHKPLLLLCNFLTVITLPTIVLSFFFLPVYVPVLIYCVDLLVITLTNSTVKTCHQEVTNNSSILNSYSVIIGEIEKEKFTSPKLIALKQMLKTEGITASENIKKLSAIVDHFDYRYNIYIHFFLNTLLFWDIHQVNNLLKWKRTNPDIEQWFHCVGQFEALSGFANVYFNNPDWCFPEISEKNFLFDAKKIGHPLIIKQKRVCNDFLINEPKVIILTGSNMSGKSTFLRTIGVNYILAMAGSCVCASGFRFSPISVVSSIRIDDSLKDNTSLFYAELKKLGSIINMVESKEKIFFLLDEILKGTNSMDKHMGSKALIKQFVQNKAAGIIATHDISLTELAQEFPESIDNYNFDIKIENDELYFDYTLNKGVCTSLNATILMRKMGIRV